MTGLVVDASVVIAWLFDDEEESRSDRVLKRLEEAGAIVPQLWHLETRNSLLTAERRGRLSASEVNERLDALKVLPIQTDEEPRPTSSLLLGKDAWTILLRRLICGTSQAAERRACDTGRSTRSRCRCRRNTALCHLAIPLVDDEGVHALVRLLGVSPYRIRE